MGSAGGELKSTEHWNKLRGGQGAIDACIHGRLGLDLFTDFIYITPRMVTSRYIAYILCNNGF